MSDNDWEVEYVFGKRIHRGKVQYHVKWLGWPLKDSTWEPMKHLGNCIPMIEAWEKQSAQAGKKETEEEKANLSIMKDRNYFEARFDGLRKCLTANGRGSFVVDVRLPELKDKLKLEISDEDVKKMKEYREVCLEYYWETVVKGAKRGKSSDGGGKRMKGMGSRDVERKAVLGDDGRKELLETAVFKGDATSASEERKHDAFQDSSPSKPHNEEESDVMECLLDLINATVRNTA